MRISVYPVPSTAAISTGRWSSRATAMPAAGRWWFFRTSQRAVLPVRDPGAVAALSEFIDAGRIQLWTLDGIDWETFFSANEPDLRRASAVTTNISATSAKRRCRRSPRRQKPPMPAGALRPDHGRLLDGAAFSAANFVFHHPLTRVRRRSPCPASIRPTISSARRWTAASTTTRRSTTCRASTTLPCSTCCGDCRLVFCCGQGAWEERMLAETRELEQILREKDIPAWVDYWGTDVSHDWPWWHRQLQYFVGHWLDDDVRLRADNLSSAVFEDAIYRFERRRRDGDRRDERMKSRFTVR